jgi:hypothetical protein
MSLPKKLLDAVKQDKEMLKLKLEQLKESLSKYLFEVKKAVEEGPKKQDSKEETAFSSIINQGKLAEEQIKIDVAVKTLQEQLITTSSSTSIEQKAAIQEQIQLLKGDKLNSLEAKREAREMAEKSVEALENIAEGQSDLIKEFKEGFSELRGEGLGGLIKMLTLGIPAILAGFTVGVVKPLMTFLSQFKTLAFIFGKTGSSFNKIVRNLRAMFSAKGSVGKIFVGFIKTIKAFAAKGGTIGKLVGNLLNYVGVAFKFGSGLAKLAGPIGIAISIITGLIGGIKGAIKGFKEDGIIGMVREGIIGVFNGLIGGLFKMVGSMIGGIFKLLGFEQIGEAIKGGFSDFVDGIIGAFRGIFNIIAGLFTLDFGMLKEGVGQLLDGIINIVFGAIKPIIAAFKTLFDGVKFLFTELPGMLIDKVKTFFTSMVESIGDAFKTAFGFVKRIGKASRAALKAALPGGESPKEAFMRVMGGDKGGEEKEEKKNAEKIKEESSVEAVSMPSEKVIPSAPKNQKETIKEFETRMITSMYPSVDTAVAPPSVNVNAAIPETKVVPTANYIEVLSGNETQRSQSGSGITPVLSSETPTKKESLESAFAYGDTTAGLLDPMGAARRVENAGPSVLSPAASIASGPKETKVPKKLSFMDVIKKAGNFAKKAASFTPPGLLFKGISKVKNLMSSKSDSASPLQDIIDNLPKEAREKILQGVSASNLVSSEERETIIEKLARSQSSSGRIGALKKFDLAASGQIAKDKLSPISSTGGAQLTMAQKENAELKGEVNTGGGAAIIAPSSVNNSQSSVSNVTVAAPPHIDKTQTLFGTTQLAY